MQVTVAAREPQLTANAVPTSGRVLLGIVQVRTDANVLVGSGDVIIQSVTT